MISYVTVCPGCSIKKRHLENEKCPRIKCKSCKLKYMNIFSCDTAWYNRSLYKAKCDKCSAIQPIRWYDFGSVVNCHECMTAIDVPQFGTETHLEVVVIYDYDVIDPIDAALVCSDYQAAFAKAESNKKSGNNFGSLANEPEHPLDIRPISAALDSDSGVGPAIVDGWMSPYEKIEDTYVNPWAQSNNSLHKYEELVNEIENLQENRPGTMALTPEEEQAIVNTWKNPYAAEGMKLYGYFVSDIIISGGILALAVISIYIIIAIANGCFGGSGYSPSTPTDFEATKPYDMPDYQWRATQRQLKGGVPGISSDDAAKATRSLWEFEKERGRRGER
ncbi:hypothetical protein BH11PLA2_BH11PLA2_37850 [soil metagenome]